MLVDSFDVHDNHFSKFYNFMSNFLLFELLIIRNKIIVLRLSNYVNRLHLLKLMHIGQHIALVIHLYHLLIVFIRFSNRHYIV